MGSTSMRRSVSAAIVTTLLGGGLVAGSVGVAGAAEAPTLQDLSSLDELRSAFLHDAGKLRVILLLSPT